MPYHIPGREHRLRIGRHSLAGQIYLLTLVTAGRHPWFADFCAARQVVSALRMRQQTGDARSLAWVVMPDHVHWLMQLNGPRSLAVVVRSLKSQATRSINAHRHEARAAPVWQSSFHDRAIRRDEDVRAVARYVVANPLRSGLVDRIGDYPHWDAAWLGEGDAVDLLW